MHFYASPFKCTAPPCALDYRRTAPFQCAVIQACCFFRIRVRGEFLSFSLIPSCIRSLPASSCLMQSRLERIPEFRACVCTSRALRALRLQCSGKAVQDSGAVELGSALSTVHSAQRLHSDSGAVERQCKAVQAQARSRD